MQSIRRYLTILILVVALVIGMMPAMTQDAYAGTYDVDYTEFISGLKDGKIEQGSTITLDVEKAINSSDEMMQSFLDNDSVEVMLRTYSPSDMIPFDYNSSTLIATLNVSADKAYAGAFVNVVIVIGGTGGDLFYSPQIDVVEKPASDTPTPLPVIAAPAEIPGLPAVKITKPKAAKKAVTVKWKKVSKKNQKKIGGIEIQIATDSGFTNIIKTATAGKKKTSKKIKGLPSKKTVWVRIRAYKKAADGKHVSAWKSKKVKIK